MYEGTGFPCSGGQPSAVVIRLLTFSPVDMIFHLILEPQLMHTNLVLALMQLHARVVAAVFEHVQFGAFVQR